MNYSYSKKRSQTLSFGGFNFLFYTQQISSRDRTEKVSQEKETKKQHYALRLQLPIWQETDSL